jgi:hypothetical protein
MGCCIRILIRLFKPPLLPLSDRREGLSLSEGGNKILTLVPPERVRDENGLSISHGWLRAAKEEETSDRRC